MGRTEAPFNINKTVEKWNREISSSKPLTAAKVEKLAIDTVHLAATIYQIPVTELRSGEEIAWENQAGYVGLNNDGTPWVSVGFAYGDVKVLVEHGVDPTKMATFVWKGILLKHKAAEALKPHEDAVSKILGLSK